MQIIAGIDLGGTAVNYTLVDFEGRFLIEDLCEHPARSIEGPDICLRQIADGLAIAVGKAGVALDDVVIVGLDTPGPASAVGRAQRAGIHELRASPWAGLRHPRGCRRMLRQPVTYLNDGNAGALWGHFSIFGSPRKRRRSRQSSAPGSAAASSSTGMSSRAATDSAASSGTC